MFSTCSKLTPHAPIPDGGMAQFMQPWVQESNDEDDGGDPLPDDKDDDNGDNDADKKVSCCNDDYKSNDENDGGDPLPYDDNDDDHENDKNDKNGVHVILFLPGGFEQTNFLTTHPLKILHKKYSKKESHG